jgi:hypothetical protein
VAGENYLTINLTTYHYDYAIKKVDMGGACSMMGETRNSFTILF